MSVGPGSCGCQCPKKHVVIWARKQPVHSVVTKTLSVLRVRMIEGREPALRDKHHRLEFSHYASRQNWPAMAEMGHSGRIDTPPTVLLCPRYLVCGERRFVPLPDSTYWPYSFARTPT